MNNMIDIPKPPERGDKSLEEYTEDIRRWANKIYDAIRYINEIGETSDDL